MQKFLDVFPYCTHKYRNIGWTDITPQQISIASWDNCHTPPMKVTTFKISQALLNSYVTIFWSPYYSIANYAVSSHPA